MVKRGLWLVVALLLSVVGVRAEEGNGVTVLLYHHLLEEADMYDNACIISLERFEEHIAYLAENGYRSVTLSELASYLYDGVPIPEKCVMITFDDGYASNYVYAYPVLKAYGFTGVVFPVVYYTDVEESVFDPDRLNRITWRQIELGKDVFEYGSHTYQMHEQIDGVAALLARDEDEVEWDLRISRALLEDTIAFAYPYGSYSQNTVMLLKGLGYKLAFTTQRGKITATSDPYQLCRYGIFNGTTVETLEQILQ